MSKLNVIYCAFEKQFDRNKIMLCQQFKYMENAFSINCHLFKLFSNRRKQFQNVFSFKMISCIQTLCTTSELLKNNIGTIIFHAYLYFLNYNSINLLDNITQYLY